MKGVFKHNKIFKEKVSDKSMIVDKSLRNILEPTDRYTRIREIQERFIRGQESARDMVDYYLCKHNIFQDLSVQQETPKLKRRYENKARNSAKTFIDFGLVAQARLEEDFYDLMSRCFLHLSEN